MKRVVTKASLHGANDDAAYWLSHTPAERIAAVEMLRHQAHANLPDAERRLQRVFAVTQLHERAAATFKDRAELADVEAIDAASRPNRKP